MHYSNEKECLNVGTHKVEYRPQSFVGKSFALMFGMNDPTDFEAACRCRDRPQLHPNISDQFAVMFDSESKIVVKVTESSVPRSVFQVSQRGATSALRPRRVF